jgi:hypothetical protein
MTQTEVLVVAFLAAIVWLPGLYCFFRDWAEVRLARAMVAAQTGRERPAAVAEPESLAGRVATFVGRLEDARAAIALDRFDVDAAVEDLRRTALSRTGRTRAVASFLILLALTINLAYIGLAVGGLDHTFTAIRAAQATQSGLSGSASSAVFNGMGEVARAARTAFTVTAWAVSFAVILLLLSAGLPRKISALISEFSDWAHDHYAKAIAGTVSLHTASADLKIAATSMERLTGTFARVIEAFEAVTAFRQSMEIARDAIVDAMRQLPVHIQESTAQLSQDFVENMAQGLRDADENMKKILLIYGEQQHRIEATYSMLDEVRTSAVSTAGSASKLEGLDDCVRQASAAVDRQGIAVAQFETTVAELAIRVEELPLRPLREDVRQLEEGLRPLHALMERLTSLTEKIAGALGLLRGLPESGDQLVRLAERQTADQRELRKGADEMREMIRRLPIHELEESLAALAAAARQLSDERMQIANLLSEQIGAVLRHIGEATVASQRHSQEHAKEMAGIESRIVAGADDLRNLLQSPGFLGLSEQLRRCCEVAGQLERASRVAQSSEPHASAREVDL